MLTLTRQYIIVSFMKQQSRLDRSELFELTKYAARPRFVARDEDIEKQIERLLKKGYIERDGGEFKYVA